MPKPSHRSKAEARHHIKTPGHRNVTHYWRRMPKKAHCAICKKPLQSVPRARPAKMSKIPLTRRRANRTESARYCAKCLQSLIRESIWK